MASGGSVAIVGPDGTIMLPEQVRRRLGLEPGTTLQLVERSGTLELTLPSVPTETDAAPAAEAALPSTDEMDEFWTAWWDEAQGPGEA